MYNPFSVENFLNSLLLLAGSASFWLLHLIIVWLVWICWAYVFDKDIDLDDDANKFIPKTMPDSFKYALASLNDREYFTCLKKYEGKSPSGVPVSKRCKSKERSSECIADLAFLYIGGTLLLIVTFFFYPIMLTGILIYGILRTARMGVRTATKLTVHVEDLKAHKKCDCIKDAETCRECR